MKTKKIKKKHKIKWVAKSGKKLIDEGNKKGGLTSRLIHEWRKIKEWKPKASKIRTNFAHWP